MGKYNNIKEKSQMFNSSFLNDEIVDKEQRQKRRENKLKNKNKQNRNDYRWN